MFALAIVFALSSAFVTSKPLFAVLYKSFSVQPAAAGVDDAAALYNSHFEVILEPATASPLIQNENDLINAAVQEFEVASINDICDQEQEEDLCLVQVKKDESTDDYTVELAIEGERIPIED